MSTKRILSMVMSLILVISVLSGCSNAEKKEEDVVTIRFLDCWNGSTLPSGVDFANNAVADVIAEKTGVRIEHVPTTTSEIERLNLAFSTGDIPDIINAPYWGRQDAHTVLIKKAAREGLLLPMDSYIQQYAPNLRDAFEFWLNQDFKENDINAEDFGGDHYVIPYGLPESEADVVNNAFNVYIRKDILDSLGVDPKTIDHSEKLYALLKQIRDAGFKATNGEPVIPAGTWHNGYTTEPFVNSYVSQRDSFSMFTNENGKLVYRLSSENYKNSRLFLRKLIAEDLLDKECFTQSSAIATEKLAIGKIAVVGSTYERVKSLEDVLYSEHPEMQYVPLGPIMNADNEPYNNSGLKARGSTGCGVIMVSANTKHAEAVFKLLNFLNSDEGKLLITYGVEGVHYDMINGQPRLKEQYLELYKQDPNNLKKEGIGLYNRLLHKAVSTKTRYGEEAYGTVEVDEMYELAKEASPMEFVPVYSLNYIAPKYDKWEDINAVMSKGDYGYGNKMIFAKTEAEAIGYFNQLQKELDKGGMNELEAFLQKNQPVLSE